MATSFKGLISRMYYQCLSYFVIIKFKMFHSFLPNATYYKLDFAFNIPDIKSKYVKVCMKCFGFDFKALIDMLRNATKINLLDIE